MNTTTKYSVSDAANLYKKSRATLYKDIKNGTLSRDQDGLIDFSELLRVYGEPLSKTRGKRIQMYPIQQDNTPEYNHDTVQDLKHQIAFLKQQLEKAEHREAQANQRIDTLLTLIEMKPSSSSIDQPQNQMNEEQETINTPSSSHKYEGFTTQEKLPKEIVAPEQPVKRSFLSRFFN